MKDILKIGLVCTLLTLFSLSLCAQQQEDYDFKVNNNYYKIKTLLSEVPFKNTVNIENLNVYVNERGGVVMYFDIIRKQK